jgi:hypothetical protein
MIPKLVGRGFNRTRLPGEMSALIFPARKPCYLWDRTLVAIENTRQSASMLTLVLKGPPHRGEGLS